MKRFRFERVGAPGRGIGHVVAHHEGLQIVTSDHTVLGIWRIRPGSRHQLGKLAVFGNGVRVLKNEVGARDFNA